MSSGVGLKKRTIAHSFDICGLNPESMINTIFDQDNTSLSIQSTVTSRVWSYSE